MHHHHCNPLRKVALAGAMALLCAFCLVGALFASTAYASDAVEPVSSTGQTVTYYDGDFQVELNVAMDRLAVVGSGGTKSGAALQGALQKLAPGATTEAAGSKGQYVIYASPAANTGELASRAMALSGAGYSVTALAYPSGLNTTDDYRIIPSQIAVKLLGPVDPASLMSLYNLKLDQQISYSVNTYIFTVEGTDPLRGVTTANAIYESGVAEFASPLVEQQARPNYVPNDPLFLNQWHLRNTGQVETIIEGNDANAVWAWDFVTGAGVNILVVDAGVQMTHEDLKAHVISSLGNDVIGADSDPSPYTGESHGTCVAGVAAAVGDNSIGVTGVAYNANIIPVRYITSDPDAQAQSDALSAAAANYLVSEQSTDSQAMINTNSWGYYPGALHGVGGLSRAALSYGTTYGRNGKGVIYLWAGGNFREYEDNSNYSGLTTSRYTISVAASGGDGVYSYYSNPGASLLVNAPSGAYENGASSGVYTALTTTTIDGYTDVFDGTSAATPVVAGVVALMLERNPNLSWRDVQHILVETAQKNDPTDDGWFTNGAGYHFNHNYGFGRVDATAAVDAATSWLNVPAYTSLPTLNSLYETNALPAAIPDNSPSGVSAKVSVSTDESFSTEHVELKVYIDHANAGDLTVSLISPSGTESILSAPHSWTQNGIRGWTFMTVANWGEDPTGDWTVKAVDSKSGTTGTLQSFELTIYGYAQGAAGTLSISPSSDFASSGNVGGPFSPASASYMLTNAGASAVNWEVTESPSWIVVSPATSGTIGAGSSQEMTLALAGDTAAFEAGSYSGYITFKNMTTSQGIRIRATLQVTEVTESKPQVLNSVVTPTTPYTAYPLSLVYTYDDSQGFLQAGEEIQWLLDGVQQTEFDNVKTVPAASTRRGDVWTCMVRVQNSVDVWSDWVTAGEVTVLNTAPELSAISGQSVNVGDVITLTAEAADDDNDPTLNRPSDAKALDDPLTYSVKISGSASNYTINANTGVFQWDTAGMAGGTYTANFTVKDTGSPVGSDTVSAKFVLSAPCDLTIAPANVKASDGTFTDRVRVSFSLVTGSTKYNVYRGEDSDSTNAVLLGSVTQSPFDDYSAAGDEEEDSTFGCSSGGSGSGDGPTYYYWVAAVNTCGESVFGGPDTGYTGAGTKSAQGATFNVYEKVLPSASLADGVQRASQDDEFAIRLRSNSAIEPSSLQLSFVVNGVQLTQPEDGMVSWVAAEPGSNEDGWAIFTPAMSLPVGALVSMTAEANTVDGAVISPVTYSFSVSEQTASGNTVAVAPAVGVDAPPAFSEGVGVAYQITPNAVFSAPQHVVLPVPDGYEAGQLAVYYYLANGADSGWYPASAVDGWLVPGSLAQSNSFLAFDVRHAGIAQLGLAASTPQAMRAGAFSLSLLSGNALGDVLLLAVTALCICLYGRRRTQLARNSRS